MECSLRPSASFQRVSFAARYTGNVADSSLIVRARAGGGSYSLPLRSSQQLQKACFRREGFLRAGRLVGGTGISQEGRAWLCACQYRGMFLLRRTGMVTLSMSSNDLIAASASEGEAGDKNAQEGSSSSKVTGPAKGFGKATVKKGGGAKKQGGTGSTTPPKKSEVQTKLTPVVGSPETREIQKVMREAKKLGSRGLYNRQVALQGRVDFVEVEEWGAGVGGEPELESLKMKSFSSAFSPADPEAPFYDQIVRRIQVLESQGDLAVAQARPLPPFERWAFGESSYLQFLVDLLAVNEALEEAVEGSAEGVDVATRVSGHGVSGPGAKRTRAAEAVAIFRKDLGITRLVALRSDIAALAGVMGKAKKIKEPIPPPAPQNLAYAKYIRQIGQVARQEGPEADVAAARHRLLAHVFSVNVTHLSTGMRVGAKALEVLPQLRKAGAVSLYRDYPPEARNPLKVFVEAINRAGSLLKSTEAMEEVMEELPRALTKSSLLLSELAVEEQRVVI